MGHQYEMLTERNFYFNPSTFLVTKVTVVGEFNCKCFNRAVQELERIHSIITSIVIEDEEGKTYFQEQPELHVPIKYFQKRDNAYWLEVTTKEEKIPVVFDKEPPLRFLVFYNDKDFDIVLLIHHMLADGMACKYLMQDLLDIYCKDIHNLPIQPTRLLSGPDDLPADSAFPKVFTDQIQEINKEWGDIRRKFTKQEYEKLYNDFYQDVGLSLLVDYIEEKDYETLIKRCKEYDVTVNSALVTAFLYAVYKDKQEAQKVTIAVNLRKHVQFKVNRCVAGYSGCIALTDKFDEAESFWTNVIRNHKKIKEELSSTQKVCSIIQLFMNLDGSVFDPLYFARNGTYQGEILKKAGKVLGYSTNEDGFDLSNLGLVDIDPNKGKYLITDYVFFANLTSVYDFTIGVATLGERLSLAVCYKANKLNEEKVKQYVRDSIKVLIQ